ncbi:MAG: SLBB domain-containing protein [Pyrinomonadaceae bacterium]
MLFATTLFVGLGALSLSAQNTRESVKVLPSDTLVATATEKNDRYRIGFQDVLNIQVFQHPDLSQTVPVSPNGTIVLFRLDRPVIAVCKTEFELATEIAGAYKKKFIRDPQVNVVVAEQKSQSVAVIGAVEKPGNFYVNRRIHLLEMLAMAGGPNRDAGTRLLIARTGSTSNCKESGDPAETDQVEVFGFKVRDIQEGKQTFWMQPGDVVSVLDADIIYVYGNVNRQGSYKVREPITLTQAIVSAEGLKPTANKSKVRILRQKQSSVDREELVFDINQIDKGKIKDPYLEPNDIVAVSEDRTKSILLGLANSIKSSVPNVIYKFPVP